ncbi:hypothetical protein LFM09_46625 [Lentzea alba]|uniref:hypothetical protein n=1 Tax=Lentzea alba TaxID=2714351 RepID=UPI0039BF9A92
MKLLPVQWAAVVLIVVDAIIVATVLATGTALLPWPANLALVLASVALMIVMLLMSGGSFSVKGFATLFRLLRETLPKWAIALAAVAFYGGWLLFMTALASDSFAGNLNHENGKYTSTQRKVVRELTEEQYVAAQAASQRAWTGFSLAFAGGVLGFAGMARRIKETG